MTETDETRTHLRVAVLVDLEWSPTAGGHVKCWERLSEALGRHDLGIELDVYFQGHEPSSPLAGKHVRFCFHRPVFSSRRLPFTRSAPDHSDLGWFHPGLLRCLSKYDVIHTTDAYFAYARTAILAKWLYGIPLVTSLHTDTPGDACVSPSAARVCGAV